MSFSSPPAGLVRVSKFARYSDLRDGSEWPKGEIVLCTPEPPFGEYLIFTPDGGAVALAASPASIEFFGTVFLSLAYAPYYTLRVKITSPNDLISWFDPPVCVIEPPFVDYVNAGPEATVSLEGTYVEPDGTAIGTDPTVFGSGSEVAATSLSIEGFLVNPAPPWPSPDVAGNTFGSVLWAADELPTVIGNVATQSGPHAGNDESVGIEVVVQPYLIVPGSVSGDLMCVL